MATVLAQAPAHLRKTAYGQWIEREGIPIVSGYSVDDIYALPLEPWARLGGRGAFMQIEGMAGVSGAYVVEIPPGGTLEPEKHMYEEVMYVLRGRGTTQVWGEGQPKRFFEWGEGSLFASPLNTWHQLINGSNEPALIYGVTNAPLVMDIYHSMDFVFNCDHQFTDRYQGQADYFQVGDKRYQAGKNRIWVTNFIPDARLTLLDDAESKGAGNHATQFEIAANGLIGHIHEWPAGRYHRCHYHMGGAVLLVLRSVGYSLMWPPDAGIRPYQNGREDSVVRMDWKPGTVFGPPHGWFHGHFNTGSEPGRMLAIRYGGDKHDTGLWRSFARQEDGFLSSLRDGGTVIDYEDEDPEIRHRYLQELEGNGGQIDMPPITYRN